MKKCAALLTTIALTACADRAPLVATVDTVCIVTTRYRATDAQVAALKADRGLWEPLVDWLASFNRERDKRCLAPVLPGSKSIASSSPSSWVRGTSPRPLADQAGQTARR